MTIRIYPSRLPGEPLETHEHKSMSLDQWFTQHVRNYRNDMVHPVAAAVNGRNVPPAEWPLCHIEPDSDVRLYPVPAGAAVPVWAVWTAIAVTVAAAAYSIYMMNQMSTGSYSSSTGSTLDLNPAKANSAKLGDPIREVFGRRKIYPDYLVQPVGRFDPNNPENYTVQMLLSLGVGNFSFSAGDIRVGDTPISSLGGDFSYAAYGPGAYVAGDARSENWFTSTEVGGTSSGSGLDMGTTSPDSDDILADSLSVAGDSVTFNGLDEDDNDDGDPDDNKLPGSWVAGATVNLIIPDNIYVSVEGQYNRFTGDNLMELAASVGMPVTLSYNGVNYDLVVASYIPHGETTDPVSGETTIITASLTLAYNGATGTAFYGVPAGNQRVAISYRGYEYRLLTVDGTTVTVSRLVNGAVDETWPGFASRTALDFSATGINGNDAWLGPFLACPENETVDCVEVNFSFPSGICGFDDSGSKRIRHTEWEIQYRVYNSGGGWISRTGIYAEKDVNGLGFTERIDLGSPGVVEVRCRRTNEQGSNNARDNMYWQALRGRLPTRPTSYANITTMAVSVVTGGKLAAQSDRRINVVATRNYDAGGDRTISGAFYHVARSLGFTDSQIDRATIDALESNTWSPRGEYFDYAAESDDTSALDVLQKITNAGMGYCLLSDGLLSAGREGVKGWAGVITPQETTEEMQTAFKAPSEDDYDGVDVTYINGTTWAEETVQCRTTGNPTPRKIESYTLDGVLDQNRAYRIGMRRLMGYLYQRLTHTASMELDPLCYQFMDRLVLTDDIPGNQTISCLIVDSEINGNTTTLHVSESLDWSFPNPRALVRWQDGVASELLVPTRIDDYTLTVPQAMQFYDGDDPYIEPPRLIFCSSARVGYDGLATEIAPSSDGTSQVTCTQYDVRKYQYDDAVYPGDVS
ncbi:host specificity factor TipJ family phage tail protein [Sodalis ligni]|uniref:Tip attachment protein J HDII-ins2 domain-containing protein n=1 Tax=Sodalis ligni TaxID=2697027 RepID=A0A4V2Q3J0_9GAMM|nr:host specificity factor TipJ family phage tail protein [Sodalis ligni]TCL06918.1 hypothetical protein EZJ58_5216 [Sodalis ligni]